MIKIRLNALSPKEETLNVIEGESILQTFERAKKEHPQINDQTENFYKAYLYGHEIPKDMWANIKPKDANNLMIGIVPESGSNGRLLGQIAILAVVIATTVATGGGASAYWAPALAGFAATLVVNALIKAPTASLGGLGSDFGANESQMYTIDSQANSINKYGPVPRVYGKHKIFPTIAAAPYTEFFADNQGELAQYFYAIYDFGYGPLKIENLRIGNTPIVEFNEVNYRLVDLNKPAIDEGDWDTAISDVFALYKGDNNTENIAVNLNGNSDGGGPADEYQVVRNANQNANNDEQEILIQFVCPQGLRTIDTAGNNVARNIEVSAEFAEVGTENWYSYNNQSQVKDFSSVGQVTEEGDFIPIYLQQRAGTNEQFLPFFSADTRQLTLAEANFYSQYNAVGQRGNLAVLTNPIEGYYLDTYKYRKGDFEFYSSKFINLDAKISLGGEGVGTIIQRDDLGGFYRYTMDEAFKQDLVLFSTISYKKVISGGGGPGGGPVIGYLYLDGTDGLNYLGPRPSDLLKVENLSGRFVITASKQNPVFSTIKFTPITTEDIKIRITRVRSYGGATFQIIDDLTWSSLNTRFATPPILTSQRHVFLEIRIKATDQLNGSITNLSGIASSVLPVYDSVTDTWPLQETSNPAWVYVDILTGDINKRALNKDRIDTASFIEYAEFCEEVPAPPAGQTYAEPRFKINFILDYKTTAKDLISQVTGQTQASLNIINGKYGVLVDKLKTLPVQVFTPRNSSNFGSSRSYIETPDALKIIYLDQSSDYISREEIVYDDGFDSSTAETFEEVGTFGVTNDEQAWRFGRYLIAQARLRQETISIDVDFENLVCTRGDFVKFQHDVMKVGGRPTRVSAIAGSDVTLDDDIITEFGIDYGYTFRSYLGIFTGTMTVTGPDTATLSGPELPEVGDLFIWGEVDKITIDCLVKEIQPQNDFRATLTLVEKADAIYEAESTGVIPAYENNLGRSVDEIDASPSEVQNLEILDNTFDCDGSNYIYQISLTWGAPLQNVADAYEVYVKTTAEYELADVIKATSYIYTVNQLDLNINHDFKVLGVSSNGQKLTLGEVSAQAATPVKKVTPPSDVGALYINVLNETLQLSWPLIADCDVLEYEIRYSPNLNANWESSNFLQSVDRKTNQIQFQARTGSYYVKAIDFNVNQSLVAAKAITSIPALVDLNVVDETNDFPDLLGPKDRVETFDSQLVLRKSVNTPPNVQFYSEGFYYYQNLLTLDDIYIVRLQSLIEAEGFTPNDLMVNWTPLSAVTVLATAGTSDWFVETQYRSTDQLNVMTGWTTLDVIDPISEGVQDNFIDWRSFTIGDFSGRIFQFRLRLVSLNPSVSPRVFEGKIKADMPDRQASGENIIAPSLGQNIVFDPQFYGPSPAPAIAISQDNAQSGDRYEITNKSLAGFTINFYDSGGTPVSRQFDYLVKGYGRRATDIL